MLSRYKFFRGKRPPDDPLPDGVRVDTRWRTRHPLRPTEDMAREFLESTKDRAAWATFKKAYLDLLDARFKEDRTPFDELAEKARTGDVFLGCNCPTNLNPRVEHCHTYLALQFMKRKYRSLDVQLPAT